LLRDRDGDGIAETRMDYITGLNGPFGMALVGSTLYVADADALLAFPYDPRAATITAPPRRITRLPAQRNQHWMKSLAAGPDGQLYVGIGANSNIAENGMWEEEGRASIWQVDPVTGEHEVFASGLRNPAALAFAPGSDRLYAVVQERDGLGDELVPDYLTRIGEGGFYGWPWSYYGNHVDRRVEPPRPDLVRQAIAPDYALGPHVGALGLAFSRGQRLGPAFANGVFVSERGTWERGSDTGFRVVFVPFEGGRPGTGAPIDVLTGFVSLLNRAWGRPAGLQLARDGALLVADDAGGVIWRVTGG
jgi:glucose/arabinose dehydrogenase